MGLGRTVQKMQNAYHVTINVYNYLKENNLYEEYKNAFAEYVISILNLAKYNPQLDREMAKHKMEFLTAIEFAN